MLWFCVAYSIDVDHNPRRVAEGKVRRSASNVLREIAADYIHLAQDADGKVDKVRQKRHVQLIHLAERNELKPAARLIPLERVIAVLETLVPGSQMDLRQSLIEAMRELRKDIE